MHTNNDNAQRVVVLPAPKTLIMIRNGRRQRSLAALPLATCHLPLATSEKPEKPGHQLGLASSTANEAGMQRVLMQQPAP